MKGMDECTHYGKWEDPPLEANCSRCGDVNACCRETAARLREKGGWLRDSLAGDFEELVR